MTEEERERKSQELYEDYEHLRRLGELTDLKIAEHVRYMRIQNERIATRIAKLQNKEPS